MRCQWSRCGENALTSPSPELYFISLEVCFALHHFDKTLEGNRQSKGVTKLAKTEKCHAITTNACQPCYVLHDVDGVT